MTDTAQELYKRDKRSPTPKSAAVSKIMSKIKGKETKPEILLRKALFKSGLRGYRKNVRTLPGKPDIVYTKSKLVVFINGCFWHGCEFCGWREPKHNTTYWKEKISKNKLRDAVKQRSLEELGFCVIVVWEHELKANLQAVVAKISSHLK